MKGPTPGEVLAAREAAGLTQEAAAKLLHLGDGRAWRQYESGGRAMSAAHWELFLIKTGVLVIRFSQDTGALILAPAALGACSDA